MAGGQDYEVYAVKKAVKKVGTSRKKVEKSAQGKNCFSQVARLLFWLCVLLESLCSDARGNEQEITFYLSDYDGSSLPTQEMKGS